MVPGFGFSQKPIAKGQEPLLLYLFFAVISIAKKDKKLGKMITIR
jgi:hypothetical protein